MQSGPDLVAEIATILAGHHIPQQLFRDLCRGDVTVGVGGGQLLEQSRSLLVGEPLRCPQQPTAIDPLDITLRARRPRSACVTRRRTASTVSFIFERNGRLLDRPLERARLTLSLPAAVALNCAYADVP